MSQVPQLRVFCNLSAGSTTYTPSGKCLQFNGKIETQGFDVKVGRGYYETDIPEDIRWLENLCKAKPPMVWEVLPEAGQTAAQVADGNVLPAAVVGGLPDALKTVGDELAEKAVASSANLNMSHVTSNSAVDAARAAIAARK